MMASVNGTTSFQALWRSVQVFELPGPGNGIAGGILMSLATFRCMSATAEPASRVRAGRRIPNRRAGRFAAQHRRTIFDFDVGHIRQSQLGALSVTNDRSPVSRNRTPARVADVDGNRCPSTSSMTFSPPTAEDTSICIVGDSQSESWRPGGRLLRRYKAATRRVQRVRGHAGNALYYAFDFAPRRSISARSGPLTFRPRPDS